MKSSIPSLKGSMIVGLNLKKECLEWQTYVEKTFMWYGMPIKNKCEFKTFTYEAVLYVCSGSDVTSSWHLHGYHLVVPQHYQQEKHHLCYILHIFFEVLIPRSSSTAPYVFFQLRHVGQLECADVGPQRSLE